jgi:hypothetical protein
LQSSSTAYDLVLLNHRAGAPGTAKFEWLASKNLHPFPLVPQFDFNSPRGVIPKPGALQPGEGSPIDRRMRAGDPSLRLKSGSAQDDATERNSN